MYAYPLSIRCLRRHVVADKSNGCARVCLDILVYFQAGPLHVGIFRWPDCYMVGHTCVDLSVLLLAGVAPLADTLVDGWYHILPGDVEVDGGGGDSDGNGDGDGGGDSDSDSGYGASDSGYGENGGLYYCESGGGADGRGEGGGGGSSAASVGRDSVGQVQVSVRPRLRLAPPHRGGSRGEEAETRAGMGTGIRAGAEAQTGSGGRWKWMTQGPNNGSPPRQGSAEDTGGSMGSSMGSSMGGLGSFEGNYGHVGWTGMVETSTAGYMDVPPFPVQLGPRGGGGGGSGRSTMGEGRATRLAVPVVVAGGGGATPPLVGFVAGRSDRAWDAFTSCLHDLSLG